MIPNPNKNQKWYPFVLVLLVALIAGCNSQKAETSVFYTTCGKTEPPLRLREAQRPLSLLQKPLVEGNALESQTSFQRRRLCGLYGKTTGRESALAAPEFFARHESGKEFPDYQRKKQ